MNQWKCTEIIITKVIIISQMYHLRPGVTRRKKLNESLILVFDTSRICQQHVLIFNVEGKVAGIYHWVPVKGQSL